MIDQPIPRLIAALRSGDYEQTMGELCTKTETGRAYCAEGVLADLIVRENPDYHWFDEYVDPGLPVKLWNERDREGYVYALTGAVTAGMDPTDRELLWWAASMNDRGRSFAEIADALEARIHGGPDNAD